MTCECCRGGLNVALENRSPSTEITTESFPAGTGNIFRFATFNALSYPIILSSPMILFAKSLGASATVLGIVAGMMPLLVVFQIPAARHIGRVGYKRFVLGGWTMRVMFIAGMAVVPLLGAFLNASAQLALLLLMLFSFNLSRGISSAAWLPWMTSLLPEGLRARYLSRDAVLVSVANCVTLVIAGLVLGASPSSWRFALIFAFSAAMGAMSLRYLARIPDVALPESERTSSEPIPWRALAAYDPFRRLLRWNLAWSVAYGGMGAFSVSYLKTATTMGEDQILALTGVAFLGGLGGLWLFKDRMDLHGSKPVISLCLLGWVVLCVGWFAFSAEASPISWWGILILELGMGFAFTLVNMNNTRLAMALAPEMGRSHYFVIYSVVANLSMGLSPIVWGLVLDLVGDRNVRWQGLQWNRFSVFFLGSMAAFIVSLTLASMLKEPKSGKLDALLRELLVLSPRRNWMRLWTRPTLPDRKR